MLEALRRGGGRRKDGASDTAERTRDPWTEKVDHFPSGSIRTRIPATRNTVGADS